MRKLILIILFALSYSQNEAPIAIDTSYSLYEDNMITIYLSATDSDGDALIFNIVDQPTNGMIELDGVAATYMPNANFNGYDSFTFIANDGEYDSNVATVSLIVVPVNDAPWLDDIDDAQIESSFPYTQELSASDVDGDDLTYTVSIDGDGTATISNNILTIVPNSYSGVIDVAVVVSDGSATDSAHFALTVFTSGCTAPDCCNYNPNANVDDGSCVCIDLTEGYDCDGNCIEDIDCAGVCGGNTEMDNCGVCGGDGTSCETPGDLNGDGGFNVVDVVLLVNAVMDWTYNPLGDMNEDGVNNVVDVVLLVNLVLYGPTDEGCDVELWGECYNINNTTSLNLSQNGLAGEIPPQIGNLINLTYLNLYANQLTGEIPPQIGNLINLTHLDLQMNQLSGQIPYDIGNLVNLNILHLNDNNLSGQIPENICDLALDWSGIWNHYYQIPFFDIDDNNLCPPYPDCLYEEVEQQDISNCP